MADQDSHSSRAEQRMLAVAKLKRAASLPRMKDGRRPPMHSEAVSEGEKAASEEEKLNSEEESIHRQESQEPENQSDELKTSESNHHPPPVEKTGDTEPEPELDTEPEERPTSPSPNAKKRRSRSRSRSRNSKDMKVKLRAPQSPPPLGGDSSQDENPPMPASTIPIVPPLVSPIPSRRPLLPTHLRSPTPIATELSLFFPGTSPSTPLPTLEDLQKGLMRSNSAGSSAAAGRRMAMMKLTGGTETYDPSPSPTPPPSLGRNNTVSGGERIAARQNMLSRLGTRITKETDIDLTSGPEDNRGVSSPTPKRRRRRSRRTSTTVNPNPNTNTNAGVSDSDFNSTNPNTPAIPLTPLPVLKDHYAELRALSTTPLSNSHEQSKESLPAMAPSPPLVQQEDGEADPPEPARRRSVLVEEPDEEDRSSPQQTYVGLPGTPQRTFLDQFRMPHSSDSHSNGSTDSAPASAVSVPLILASRGPSRLEMFPSSPFTTPLKEKALSDEEEEQVLYPGSTARPRTPYANTAETYDREISWVASPGIYSVIVMSSWLLTLAQCLRYVCRSSTTKTKRMSLIGQCIQMKTSDVNWKLRTRMKYHYLPHLRTGSTPKYLMTFPLVHPPVRRVSLLNQKFRLITFSPLTRLHHLHLFLNQHLLLMQQAIARRLRNSFPLGYLLYLVLKAVIDRR